jgi:hypothetical protein
VTSRADAEQDAARRTREAASAAAQAALRDSSAARASPDARPERFESTAATAQSRAAPLPSGTTETFSAGRPEAAALRMLNAQRSVVVASPDPSIRWRITAAGTVLGSTDGGASWQPQATGATTPLTAGASPSPSVCWLIGRGGVVLITTDGRSWQKLPFPEAVDLMSISATDDRNATVMTVDGRGFTTADRGQTWQR